MHSTSKHGPALTNVLLACMQAQLGALSSELSSTSDKLDALGRLHGDLQQASGGQVGHALLRKRQHASSHDARCGMQNIRYSSQQRNAAASKHWEPGCRSTQHATCMPWSCMQNVEQKARSATAACWSKQASGARVPVPLRDEPAACCVQWQSSVKLAVHSSPRARQARLCAASPWRPATSLP